MESCRLFLELNGFALLMDMEIVDIALKIATREIEFENFVDWLKGRATEL
jgi:prophage maintenance system killer protein